MFLNRLLVMPQGFRGKTTEQCADVFRPYMLPVTPTSSCREPEPPSQDPHGHPAHHLAAQAMRRFISEGYPNEQNREARPQGQDRAWLPAQWQDGLS